MLATRASHAAAPSGCSRAAQACALRFRWLLSALALDKASRCWGPAVGVQQQMLCQGECGFGAGQRTNTTTFQQQRPDLQEA